MTITRSVEWGPAEDLVLMCRDINRYDHQYV